MPKIDVGYTNRTDVAAIRVFHSLYKLTSFTLSPVSNKPSIDIVDIPLLRKQVSLDDGCFKCCFHSMF